MKRFQNSTRPVKSCLLSGTLQLPKTGEPTGQPHRNHCSGSRPEVLLGVHRYMSKTKPPGVVLTITRWTTQTTERFWKRSSARDPSTSGPCHAIFLILREIACMANIIRQLSVQPYISRTARTPKFHQDVPSYRRRGIVESTVSHADSEAAWRNVRGFY